MATPLRLVYNHDVPADPPESAAEPGVISLGDGDSASVLATLVGYRIELRTLGERVAGTSVVLRLRAGGCAVVFRYGAVVFFGVEAEDRAAFVRSLEDRITEHFEKPEIEQALVSVDSKRDEGVHQEALIIHEASPERIQVVAEILAKSVILAHHEVAMTDVFNAIEPMAERLRRSGRGFRKARGLVQHIGQVLLMQQKLVGRVEVTEKPELLWERPELERLYARLEDEYELRERHRALERKLDVISSTAETLLELLQTKRSLRVEWYIVLLIVVEILLTLYEMFGR